ncbi:T9SS type A sorting domain-containing protein [Seonamhaeicola maritimus]|uniref:T9SS type A sorting domain-containing protein n=1 Tax=Seonamhaeicola maritimus TaxID=2591822 RepID=A0A5C7GG10_9FLAO|nr:T9SS type A sorting domain-containing protein [Seonamhaeicola maritimus]TXG36112.1 T9SS type A sorting domain-containing protein [Seonamhaeicola maritimus]
MAKIFTFCKSIGLLLFLLPIYGSSQIFSSGFENSLATEWDVATSGTGLDVFAITTASKRTGNNGFHVKFSASGQKGNLWTLKNINWELGKTYRVSYYFKVISPDNGNDSHIKTFEGGGTKFGAHLYGDNVINNATTATDWVKFEDIINPEKNDTGGYILFTFRPTASGEGEYYFDDFLIEEIVPPSGFFVDIKTIDVVSEPTIEWVQFGPGMSGNNRCFYTHPTDPNTHYTSPNMGNSYRSTDKGFTYETIMNEDARSYNSVYRGPVEMYSLDFSRQDADFGFCTGKYKGSLYSTTDKGKTWTLLESTTIDSNYLSVVAVDPSDEGIWFLGAGRIRDYARLSYPQSNPKGAYLDGSANGKIWKSTDKGQTWTLSNTGMNTSADTEIETILVDPVDNSIIYAGTNYGFYKSTNGGATWSLKSNGIDNDMIRSMDLHHDTTTNQITIYALSNITWKATSGGNSVENDQGGVFKSTDRGETWTNVSSNLALDLNTFSGDGDSNVETDYYQSVAHYFGLASTAAAEAAYPVLPTNITSRFNMITVDPNDVNNVYLVNDFSNVSKGNFGPGQIWRTTNGGTSWIVTFRNGKNWNNGIHDAFWVTQRNNPIGTNITMKYKSDWINRDNYERKGCNFTKFNADGTVLYTQLAKVGFVSYDKGDTWVDIDDEEADEAGSTLNGWVGAGNSNVPGHGFYQSALWPGKVFCPSGENSLWITNDEGETVRFGAQGGSVMHLVYNNNGVRQEHSVSSVTVHPTDKDTWFATFFRQAGRGEVYKTTNAGEDWTSIGTPIPQPWDPAPPGSGDQAVHQLGLMIDKNNPNNMYFCVPKSSLKLEWVGDSCQSWGVHKSSDGGVTWSEINTGLPTSLDVARIAFDPNDSNTLYAAVIDSGGGLFKSTNGGTSWAEVVSTTAISGASGINDIHFDEDGKAYITAGFKNVGVDDGGLWVSDDNMATWTKIFDYPWTNRVEVSKLDTQTIMVSTLPNTNVDRRNAGTFLSKDAGQTWVKFNKGNGQSDRVNDIAIDYTIPGKYYASTRGSGWYMAMDPNPNSLSTEDDFKTNEVFVYPNPTSRELNIKGFNGDVNVNIYAIDGKQLLSFKGAASNSFDISSLTQGLYIYSISSSGVKVKSGKIIRK